MNIRLYFAPEANGPLNCIPGRGSRRAGAHLLNSMTLHCGLLGVCVCAPVFRVARDFPKAQPAADKPPTEAPIHGGVTGMATYIVGPCAAAYNVDDFKRIAFQPRFLSHSPLQ